MAGTHLERSHSHAKDHHGGQPDGRLGHHVGRDSNGSRGVVLGPLAAVVGGNLGDTGILDTREDFGLVGWGIAELEAVLVVDDELVVDTAANLVLEGFCVVVGEGNGLRDIVDAHRRNADSGRALVGGVVLGHGDL